MPLFELLAGQHIGPDKSKAPRKVKDAQTGEVTERYPSRTWKKGEVVDSDTDLVERFGGQKFRQVEGRRSRRTGPGTTAGDAAPAAALAPSPFPGGQVPEGFQGGPGEESPAKAPRDLDEEYGPLEELTVTDLRELAATEQIDLAGASRKDDIIKALRAAR